VKTLRAGCRRKPLLSTRKKGSAVVCHVGRVLSEYNSKTRIKGCTTLGDGRRVPLVHGKINGSLISHSIVFGAPASVELAPDGAAEFGSARAALFFARLQSKPEAKIS
jgi:hypothetical protein